MFAFTGFYMHESQLLITKSSTMGGTDEDRDAIYKAVLTSHLFIWWHLMTESGKHRHLLSNALLKLLVFLIWRNIVRDVHNTFKCFACVFIASIVSTFAVMRCHGESEVSVVLFYHCQVVQVEHYLSHRRSISNDDENYNHRDGDALGEIITSQVNTSPTYLSRTSCCKYSRARTREKSHSPHLHKWWRESRSSWGRGMSILTSEWGVIARHLTQRCTSRILVSVKEIWTKRHCI